MDAEVPGEAVDLGAQLQEPLPSVADGCVDRGMERIGIIEKGRLAFEESVDELKASYRRIVLVFDGPPPDTLRRLAGV